MTTQLDSQHVRKQWARRSLRYFAETYCGTHPDACRHLRKPHVRAPFGPVQLDLIKLLEDDKVDQLLFLAPRKWAKTTIGSLVFPLWLIAFEHRLGYMIMGGVDNKQPMRDLETLKDELFKNELFIHDFGELAAHRDRWRKESIRVYRPWDLDAPPEKRSSLLIECVSPKGSGGGVRGSKAGSECPQVLIFNDAQRTKHRALMDPGQRADYEHWFFNDMLPSRDPDWSRVCLFENLVGQASVAGKLSTGVGFCHPDGYTYGTKVDHEKAEANRRWTRRIWQMAPSGVRFEVVGGREQARINGENTWPQAYTNEWLEEDRLAGLPRATIAAEYQNDPVAPGMQTFKHVARYPGKPPVDGAAARARWPGVIIEAAIDPASSLSDTADYTAVVTVGRLPDGTQHVLHAEQRRINAPDQIEWVLALHQRWGWRQLHWETVGAQRTQYEHATRRARETGAALRITEVKRASTENKHLRIELMDPLFRGGTVKVAEEADEGVYATVTGYHQHVGHDDLMDALETVSTRLLKVVAQAPVATGGTGGKKAGDRQRWLQEQLDRGKRRTVRI